MTSWEEAMPRHVMLTKNETDSVFKMKNMTRVKNSKNTWRVPCVEIIVSIACFVVHFDSWRGFSLGDLPDVPV